MMTDQEIEAGVRAFMAHKHLYNGSPDNPLNPNCEWVVWLRPLLYVVVPMLLAIAFPIWAVQGLFSK